MTTFHQTFQIMIRSLWFFFRVVRFSHFTVTTLCAAPAKAMTFQQIIMHVLQCPHDVDVHLLFCFDLLTYFQGYA